MQKLAIVFGFSERGIPLARQLLASFLSNILPYYTHKIQCDIFPYQCNLNILNEQYYYYREYKKVPDDSYEYNAFNTDLHVFQDLIMPDNTQILWQDCSNKNFVHFHLPDIAVYQDWSNRFINDYDYVLYLHDDIVFHNPIDLIGLLLKITNKTYNMACRVTVSPNEDLSIRINPSFIFMPTELYRNGNLSFINEYSLFNRNDFRIYTNGGAALLASYYSHNNKCIGRIYDQVANDWFRHIRLYDDYSVEFSFHQHGMTEDFLRVLKEADANANYLIQQSHSSRTKQ